jgi:hypothetical protein
MNLIAPKQKSRQRWRTRRHRAFAASVLLLGLSFFFMLPRAERKRETRLLAEAMETEIQSEAMVTRKIETDIVNNRALLHVIDFSRERLGIGREAAVPMPLGLVVGSISHSLSDVVELDFIDCSLEISEPSILVELRGRPLTADIDLVETLETFEANLKNRGWLYGDWKLAFTRERSKQSRFDRRGSLRSFTLTFKLYPSEIK